MRNRAQTRGYGSTRRREGGGFRGRHMVEEGESVDDIVIFLGKREGQELEIK